MFSVELYCRFYCFVAVDIMVGYCQTFCYVIYHDRVGRLQYVSQYIAVILVKI